MLRDRTTLAMLAITLLFGVASIIWAEKLPCGDGLGWDGAHYAAWAKDFRQRVMVEKVSDYYVQRVAPSALVHYGARILLWPFYSQDRVLSILAENKNIILSFGIYNLVLLLVAVTLWALIAANLNLTEKGKWLGFCALFINYAVAKSNYYQPVLTDTTAFVLGLSMFYFFLARRPLGLFAVMIVSGFTWPTLPFLGALLLVFPRPDKGLPALAPVVARRLGFVFTIVATGVVCAIYAYLLAINLPHRWGDNMYIRIDFPVLYLSMAAVVVYLFFGFRGMLTDGRLFDFRAILRSIHWKWSVVALAALVLWRFTVRQLADPVPTTWNFTEFFKHTLIWAMMEPFIFVVAHAVYYGPIILLLLVFWKPFCEESAKYGIGLKLFMILNLCLSIGPQSRYQFPVLGVIVPILVVILERSVLPRWNLTWWVLLSFLYSKVWYTFNTAPMIPDGTMATFLTFPLQHFFMNSGPWMSHAMYLVQGSIVLGTAFGLYLATRHTAQIIPSVEADNGLKA